MARSKKRLEEAGARKRLDPEKWPGPKRGWKRLEPERGWIQKEIELIKDRGLSQRRLEP